MNAKILATRATVLASAVLLSACTSVSGGGDNIDYHSAATGTSLAVPPDLAKLAPDTRYQVPGGVVSANALLATQVNINKSDSVAPSSVGEVRIHSDGNVRWLSVPSTPQKLWGPVRQFWLDSGFTLVMDQPSLGIMETGWAENRAKLPLDWVRSTLGKLLGSLYSTGELDKFRTRLERDPDGGTDIYVTHRGMVEEYVDRSHDRTMWVPRPVDPELETEMLRRMMVKLGVSEEQSRAIAAEADVRVPADRIDAFGVASVVTLGDQPALELKDNFEGAWRRVGVALDRSGFTVEDRDRSQGVYYVRYVSPDAQHKEGFLARIFSRGKYVPPPVRYGIHIQSSGGISHAVVETETGQPAPEKEAQAIIQLLYEDLS